MCDLPIKIADEEKIVRAIICSYHIKKGKDTLKPAAFRSKAGMDEVSVIRQSFMGSDFCKAKAKEIAKGSTNGAYAGLAVLLASQIRATGSTVQDSREEFCGHAHISHGVVLPPDEPADSEQSLLVGGRCRALVELARYYPDPQPSAETWTGESL